MDSQLVTWDFYQVSQNFHKIKHQG
jgi:hypothetical protein